MFIIFLWMCHSPDQNEFQTYTDIEIYATGKFTNLKILSAQQELQSFTHKIMKQCLTFITLF